LRADARNRIGLLVARLGLPWHNAALFAEQVATLDMHKQADWRRCCPQKWKNSVGKQPPPGNIK
jgi:hypothetical protein